MTDGPYDWTKNAIGSAWVPPVTMPAWPQESQILVVDPNVQPPLTFPADGTTLPGMARTDVVEFTHHCSRDSTSIAEIWWNANTFRLTVRFHNGGVYSYDDVGRSLYNDFCTADSMGQFFREHFRAGEWPGAKHNESLVKYIAVGIEGPEEWADLDALKVTRLTSSANGGNKKFVVHYAVKPIRGKVDVRARDIDEAVALVCDYFEDKGIPAEVHGVFVEVN